MRIVADGWNEAALGSSSSGKNQQLEPSSDTSLGSGAAVVGWRVSAVYTPQEATNASHRTASDGRGGPGVHESDPTASLVIVGVNIIDVRDGSVAANITLLVDGDRISAIRREDSVRVPEGTPMLDGMGTFAIPGLWDMHAHVVPPIAQSVLPLFVANGVTGVRDIAGSVELAHEVRRAIDSGDQIGPR